MQIIMSFWNYLLISAPYLLLGFVIAGLMRSFISVETILKGLGKNSFGSVVKASLLGVPLPLCSCSVIPTAVNLKKSGASNGAVSSFLISTPESGVDSIILTYGIMDLPMAIFRPVAAFVSGFVAGLLQMFFNKGETVPEVKEEKKCCSCHCEKPERKGVFLRLKEGMGFAFFDLFNDMAPWLFVGLFCGALIDTYVPLSLLEGASGLTGRLIILAIGIPLYICASSTTPVAAALVMKGLSPGAALLLMLVGPATNVSNIIVLQKYLGKKGVILNLLAIASVALIFSYVVDWFYVSLNIPVAFKVLNMHEHGGPSLWSVILAVLFSLLLIKGLWSSIKEKFFHKHEACCHKD